MKLHMYKTCSTKKEASPLIVLAARGMHVQYVACFDHDCHQRSYLQYKLNMGLASSVDVSLGNVNQQRNRFLDSFLKPAIHNQLYFCQTTAFGLCQDSLRPPLGVDHVLVL